MILFWSPNILRIGLQMSRIWRLQKSWPLWECRQTWLRRDLSSFWGWNMLKQMATHLKKITKIHRTNRTATSILKKCEFLHLFEWYIGPHFMLMNGWKSIRQWFWYEHQGARRMIYNVHCLWKKNIMKRGGLGDTSPKIDISHPVDMKYSSNLRFGIWSNNFGSP